MAALPERLDDDDADACHLAACLATVRAERPEVALRALIDDGHDRLPLPGGGATLARWQALDAVARHDLALVKLFEGHTDALAILAEIEPGAIRRRGAARAVWASEARDAPLVVRIDATGARVDGRKAWCSGAAAVDLALLTATDVDGGRRLVELDLHGPGVRIDRDRWQAVGMRDSGSFDVLCADAPVRLVGGVDAYLRRPGFWHGGAGIAACWFGGAAAIATRVRDLQRGRDDAHALAHLGALDGALAGVASLLRECARAIDRTPRADAMRLALRARTAASDVALTVVERAARALGPGPLCNDAALARLFADLPVFVRQSRAEHDLAAQGRALLDDENEMRNVGWPL